MIPDEIRANLTAEQWELYQLILKCIEDMEDTIGEQWGQEIASRAVVEKDYQTSTKETLEALAERNRLLKKLDKELERLGYGIGQSEISGKKTLRMQITAALKGVGE